MIKLPDFEKIADGFDTSSIRTSLLRQPELWGLNTVRNYTASPHNKVTDIWARCNDKTKYEAAGSYAGFTDEHTSMWYPEAAKIDGLKPFIYDFMRFVEGDRLGTVLITKLPPGGRIERHVDTGWHAAYYSKFYFPVQNEEGSDFYFDTGVIRPQPGEVYWFDNSMHHWIVNDSNTDRLSMIVCIRTDRYDTQRHPV